MIQSEEDITIEIKLIKKYMKKVGTYNTSYTYAIETLAKTICDYRKATSLFNKTGGNLIVTHTNKNGSSNLVKNPIYLTIEKLRSDIIIFSRELGLTPAAKESKTKGADKTNEFLKFLSS